MGLKETKRHFNMYSVAKKYGVYNISMTGHSLGQQLAKHVNDSHKGKVSRNLVLSYGTGYWNLSKRNRETQWAY